jgi:transposase
MLGLVGMPEQIWLVVESVDMRKGVEGLTAMAQLALGHSPYSSAAFVFHNRSGSRLKVLLWDAQGVWLCQRRLHEGRFVWPKIQPAHQAGDRVFFTDAGTMGVVNCGVGLAKIIG